MDNLKDVVELLKFKKKDSESSVNPLLVFLAIIGIVAAVAGIAYAVYRYFAPNYLEDFSDEDFEDDFDDYFEDEKPYTVNRRVTEDEETPEAVEEAADEEE